MAGSFHKPEILALPSIRAIFEGQVEAVFNDHRWPVSLIVYLTSRCENPFHQRSTLGVLDREKDVYYEVSFEGDRVTSCRKYTPDNFSHSVSLRRFKEDYFDVLTDQLPPLMKQRLFGIFLPGDQGLERRLGGCLVTWVDSEGRYHERSIEIENRYL